jgi:formate dehydrogenase subunit delta
MSNDAPSADAHGHPSQGTAAHLVKMANDIGRYFRTEPQREDAIAGITNHIVKYWTRRMREKIAAHMKQGGDADLDDLPREALRRLHAQQAAASQPAAPQTAAR